jgi:hypothetical protein
VSGGFPPPVRNLATDGRSRLKNAFEFEATYSRDGKCLKRRWTIGGVVIWGIVTLAGIRIGHAVIPHAFWNWLKLP